MNGKSDEHRYDGIIHLPHHQSKKRKHMPIMDRAAQFGAFRALTGYEDEVAETARFTEEKTEPDEYKKAEINAKLQYIRDHLEEKQEVLVTYFVPDGKKEGGANITISGIVRKIKAFERTLILEDGTEIPIDEIQSIEGNQFYQLEF